MRNVQLIGFPLGDVELVFVEVGVSHHLEAHVVKTLQRPHTGSTDSNTLAAMIEKLGDGLAAHTDIFGVHLVALHLLTLDGLEGASTHMEGEFLTLDTVGVKIGQHLRREVKSGRRSRHATLDLRVDGLVSGLVALLRFTVKIGRNGQFTHDIDDLGEGTFSGER